MPQILRDILEHAILQQPDLQLVSDATDDPGTVACVPDVVVVAAGDDRKFGPLSLLRAWPRARVIVVTPYEGQVALYQLKPHITDFGRVSPTELVELIRDTSRRH